MIFVAKFFGIFLKRKDNYYVSPKKLKNAQHLEHLRNGPPPQNHQIQHELVRQCSVWPEIRSG